MPVGYGRREIDGYSIGRISADYRKNITILGVVSKDCLYGWYRAADAGIVPSYYEQCSYSGIEMKMFGLPIVASSGFGVRRMFTPENSIVADIGDRWKSHATLTLLAKQDCPLWLQYD